MANRSNDRRPAPCGLIVLDKPRGWTSFQAVARAGRALGTRKAGHAGTLDPLATGVLVVAVGPATRLVEFVQRQPKTYLATILLGARSDTLDADGQVEPMADPPVPDRPAVIAALADQVGTLLQAPPAYSALKIDGRRSYDLARAGVAVAPAPRPVEVYAIDPIAYQWPRLEIEVTCGSGTYIRSIARDVGDALGCGGLIEALRRTRIGPFALDHAIDPETDDPADWASRLLPALDAVADLPRIDLDETQAAAVLQGKPVPLTEPLAGPVALVGPDGRLLAVAAAEGGLAHPRKVLVDR